ALPAGGERIDRGTCDVAGAARLPRHHPRRMAGRALLPRDERQEFSRRRAQPVVSLRCRSGLDNARRTLTTIGAERAYARISRGGSLRRRDAFELGRLPFEQAAIDAARPRAQHGGGALLALPSAIEPENRIEAAPRR